MRCTAPLVALVATLGGLGSAAAEPPAREPWTWAAIPIVNFDSDAGLGLGALATLYRHQPGAEPYRAAITLQVFATTELVQAHELQWDVVEPWGARVRITGRAGYYATLTRNFCGFGNEVTCDPELAEQTADAFELPPGTDEREDFVRRYYLRRFIEPWGMVQARWPLGDGGASAFAGWRLAYLLPGDFDDRGPYPNSFYAAMFPDGQRGVVSLPQLGVAFDSRDRELTPSRGMWLEASVRGASEITGSTWAFAGANLTGRWFASLDADARLVSATRAVADGVVGDPPVEELAYPGGTELYAAFGGHAIGRGIRDHRYLGRIKLLAQQELRWRAWQGERLGLTLVGFVDAGWIALDWDEMGGDPERLLGSFGAGTRFIWRENFIVRTDVGVSPHENWVPGVYVYLGHVF